MEQIKKDSEYFNNLKEVKEFITECKQTTNHYHGLKIPGNEFDNWKNDKRVENKYAKWIIQDSNCPSLLLNIPVPYKEMTAEAEQFLDRFVKHRGGWNPGWSSIAVHGQSAERTQPANYYVEEGIDSEDNIAPYTWTEIAKDCPVTVEWLKNTFPIKEYHRVRYMLLEPEGFIQPHSDFKERRMAAFNVALSNPPGVEFALEEAGLIPWQPGEARAIDIGRNHSVLHTGTENRIHMIIHGLWADGFERCICESFEDLLINIASNNN
jgi:hypothetical protein